MGCARRWFGLWRSCALLGCHLLLAGLLVACSPTEQPGSNAGPTQTPTPDASPSVGADAEAEVVDAFASYRTALIDRDGRRVAELVADPTAAYYGEMADLALSARRADLQRRRILDKLTALYLRHLVPPGRLAEMDGREVIAFAVAGGLINDSSVETVEPIDVEVDGATALMDIEIDGEMAPFSLTFRREDAGWRIDLSELGDLSEFAFRDQMNQAGLNEDKYLMTLIESIAGSRPTRSIWTPPR